ncbi:hypothetical protein ACTXT7_013623 [Hymenolepis weldensis]
MHRYPLTLNIPRYLRSSEGTAKPIWDYSTTGIQQLKCHKCDDEMQGCRAEMITTEVCQSGTIACMRQ